MMKLTKDQIDKLIALYFETEKDGKSPEKADEAFEEFGKAYNSGTVDYSVIHGLAYWKLKAYWHFRGKDWTPDKITAEFIKDLIESLNIIKQSPEAGFYALCDLPGIKGATASAFMAAAYPTEWTVADIHASKTLYGYRVTEWDWETYEKYVKDVTNISSYYRSSLRKIDRVLFVCGKMCGKKKMCSECEIFIKEIREIIRKN